ncbi:hypothetical protein OB446_000370 [Paenibacillus alvei]|uniref:hypothetical protein n=1 Tax=Paenibacillus alvei TaxID=44250 RepID=UPI0021D2C349
MKKKLLLGVMMFTMAGQMIVPSLQAAPASNAVQAAANPLRFWTSPTAVGTR